MNSSVLLIICNTVQYEYISTFQCTHIPATQLLSSKPSIRSIISAEEVRATAKKNTILRKKKDLLLTVYSEDCTQVVTHSQHTLKAMTGGLIQCGTLI
jgi:hypothetical protein